jgi:hypothetical protein
VTIRFRVLDFPGKYVFHCHILEHEDEGMMSPVFQFGNTEGLRLALGTSSQPTVVVNGKGNTVGTINAFPNYTGPVVTASGIGTSTKPAQAPPFNGTADEINAYFRSKYTKETVVFGTGAKASGVRVYENGSLKPTAAFSAFKGKAGVTELSKFPTREEAIGQNVTLIVSPGRKLVAQIKGPGSNVAGLVKAIETKLEKGEAITKVA